MRKGRGHEYTECGALEPWIWRPGHIYRCSFRLLKGEHIGLVGANGEGKSTFMNIITGKLMPDEGTVEWAKNVRTGYLDQHTMLKKGMTVRSVLQSAFDPLFQMESEMNAICEKMGEASGQELEHMMEELGTIQELLMMHDFYMIDADGRSGQSTGAGRDRFGPGCDRTQRWTEDKGAFGKTSVGKARYPIAG